MTKSKKMRKKVYGGFSLNDSISFITDVGVVSAISESNGNIYKKYFAKANGKNENDKPREKLFNFAVFLVQLLFSFFLQYLLKDMFGSMIVYRVYEVIMFILFSFVLIIGVNDFNNSTEKTSYNHGAEHKVFNAACKYGRVPTFEEAKRAKRFSPWCGVKIYTIGIILFAINIYLACHNFYVMPSALLFKLVFVLPAIDPLTYAIQMIWTTSEPSNNELSLALHGYKAAYEIACGREITDDEVPTNQQILDWIEDLERFVYYDGEYNEETLMRVESYAERIVKENEIIDSFSKSIFWKKWATERPLILFTI